MLEFFAPRSAARSTARQRGPIDPARQSVRRQDIMRSALAILLVAQHATAFLAPRHGLPPPMRGSLQLMTAQSRDELVVDAELKEKVDMAEQ